MPAASAFKLPFGTLYSTNITADKETGIGNYSDQDFLNAVQRGIRKDGARLYPAMPYTSYTYHDRRRRAGDQGLPVQPARRARGRTNAIRCQFPFNQRWAMIFWSGRSIPNTRFAPEYRKERRSGTGAPISLKRWRIAATATRRAIWPLRWTTAGNSPAPSLPVGAP